MVPPAVKATTTRTGLVGQACAHAVEVSAADASSARAVRMKVFM